MYSRGTENCTITSTGEDTWFLQKMKDARAGSRGSGTAAAAGTAAGLRKTDVNASVFLRFTDALREVFRETCGEYF